MCSRHIQPVAAGMDKILSQHCYNLEQFAHREGEKEIQRKRTKNPKPKTFDSCEKFAVDVEKALSSIEIVGNKTLFLFKSWTHFH